MIKVLVGDILRSKAQTLVNTVNLVGIMGKGIAKEFKAKFPEMFDDYKRRCDSHNFKMGEPYLYKTKDGPWILNFPTKDHWRSVSKLSDIEAGLQFLEKNYRNWGIRSLAVPPLGCGNGELEWRVIGPTLFRYLKLLDIPVELFAPWGTPEGQLTTEFLDGRSIEAMSEKNQYRSKLDPAWIAIVGILEKVQNEQYHWPVGRTIFQKIAFIATAEGLPTGLEFHRASYGPFSRDLRQLQTVLVNNGLVKEVPSGRMIQIRVGPTYEDARNAYSKELIQWEGLINKVADLFSRLTTMEAEILATIIFSAMELKRERGCYSEEDLLNSVMDWKQNRKPALDRIEVATKIRSLGALGWLEAVPSKDMKIQELEIY